ncbi:MAG: Gfo/Idh/MocA family oxidoreductase [Eubacteriales bacterium]|nr:Gfo/Idh/MocA family oxidoreductase [Eubacteriales bacterium]
MKAVIIGFAHMHVNEIALYLYEHPEWELSGVADVSDSCEAEMGFRYTAGWNLKNICRKYCDNVFKDYRDMLDQIKPDIAFIMSENSKKAGIAEECAKRGINISIEKPMAIDREEASRIRECASAHKIEVLVNWPVMWRRYLHQLKQAVEQRLVGEPVELRYMNGHTGPLGKGAKHRGVEESAEKMTDRDRERTWWYHRNSGGGAFLDICCYGCFFTEWLLGEGEMDVLSYGANLNTSYADIEDSFAAIVRYEKKMAVLEGTWIVPRRVIPSGPMVLCTEGILVCTGGAEDMPQVKAYDLYGKEVIVPPFEMGDKWKNMAWYYADHIKKGNPIEKMLTMEENLRIMSLLDAVKKSSDSGRREAIIW